MSMSCQYLTVRETAESLGVSPATVYQWLERGLIPRAWSSPRGKIRNWRIPVGSVERIRRRRENGLPVVA